MTLTKEQEDIINTKLPSFKINAVAGSGKTTTLLEYAKNNPQLKILYLAYSKALQLQIQEKLQSYELKNIHISTIHSLAYNKIQAFRYNLNHDLKLRVIENVICEFENKINQKNNYFPTPQYTTLLKDLVNFYCNSSLINLDLKLLNSYKKQADLSAKLLKLLNSNKEKLLAHLKYILSAMKNKKIPAIHDFYLKMFFLNKKVSTNLGYDLILVDEAQDISDVMIGIVEAQNCRRIYVGDSFQQIYSFRYATNALDKIDLPSFDLSQSFRFSNTYAKLIEKSLNKLYETQESKLLKISGIQTSTKNGKNAIDKTKQYTIISRTSFALMQELINYLHKDYKLYFEGSYESYSFMNQTVYSIFYLKQKKNEKITLDEIKEFESIYELEQFAKDTKNQDYLNIIKFINTYGDNIFEINKKIKQKITLNKDEADIILTTTHKSKGLEYEQVVLSDDFITKKDIDNPQNKISSIKLIEELNILYVALTRVKKAINFIS